MRAALRIPALLLFASLVASSSQATLSITPPTPVAGVPFVVHVVSLCTSVGAATVSVGDITIPMNAVGNCCGGCYVQRDVIVGPLPVGSYTIRLVVAGNNNSVIETLPIVVVADIPALDPRVLAILAITLMAIAVLKKP